VSATVAGSLVAGLGANKQIVWIGSANFTIYGFEKNEELVAEFESDHEESTAWFEARWKSIGLAQSEALMEDYIETWSPPQRGDKVRIDKVKIPDILNHEINLDCGWPEYLEQLENRNLYWLIKSKQFFSVLEDSFSYVETISDGHAITQYDSWDNLTKQETTILLGWNDKSGAHGLLGRMGRQVRKYFKENPTREMLQERRRIFEALKETIRASNEQEYIEAVREIFAIAATIEGISYGVTTRLLALARPDMAISVNSKSQQGLAKASSLAPSTLGDINNYIKLLQWMYARDWYNSPTPKNLSEKSIWDKRAALLDAFVYDDRVKG